MSPGIPSALAYLSLVLLPTLISNMTTLTTATLSTTTPATTVPPNSTIRTESAFVLVPSQVPKFPHASSSKKQAKIRMTSRKKTVPPTLAAISANDLCSSEDCSAGDTILFNPRSSSQVASPVPTMDTLPSESQTTRNNPFNTIKITASKTGNLPDVHWRAIPLSHLRTHPNFQPLPPPSAIYHLPTKEHVRHFRQESWQWDYLHQGRCTTSQCAAALGFLEPKAAQLLGIPRSMQRGGVGAWERLRQDSENIFVLDELERVLCEDGRRYLDPSQKGEIWPPPKRKNSTWIPANRLRQPYPFMAKYTPVVTKNELLLKKEQLQKQQLSQSSMSTRMKWGNAQEATSILTALNYFCSLDPKTKIHEVGMCGAGFDDDTEGHGVHFSERDVLHGLKIGASPDAIICHGNGTVEVLEVKNHCPFAWKNQSSHHNNSKKKHTRHHPNKKRQQSNSIGTNSDQKNQEHLPKHFHIHDFVLESKVPPVYVPQLMMEMLCVGYGVDPDKIKNASQQATNICNSAIMVRQTATKGAIVLRLHRDEEWISEMKYWLGTFKKLYVDTNVIPPDNFFWKDNDNSRYIKFLQWTKDISESVEHVAYINNTRIQRMIMERGSACEIPLFLDCVHRTQSL